MLVKWVKAAIKNTGIRDVVCGGGVFMNVKANMLIQNLPEVNSMYVMPSASDESLSIGAALYHYYKNNNIFNNENGILENLYLGEDIKDSSVKLALKELKRNVSLSVIENNVENKIIDLLKEGEPIAICKGKAEWGARALGNRSIIARADSRNLVDKINAQIKMRDFWMPFAPSILEDNAKKCIRDPKSISPEFMTFALPTKLAVQKNLIGGMHPIDKTCRPQILKEKTNPFFYSLLKKYCETTNQHGVIQTSFNIHGEPIVNNSNDASSTFLRSGLRYMLIGNYLISKN